MPTDVRFVFGAFELDPDRHRLTASGEPVAMSARQVDILLTLVARAAQIVAKDDLVKAGWQDVAVGDNSLEQVISSLRRLLDTIAPGVTYIETVPRRGYRFTVPVARRVARHSHAELDVLLAPHRAFVEGRAALETLAADRVGTARDVFEDAVHRVPEHASAHVGLANVCVMQFEMTRTDVAPDAAALALMLIMRARAVGSIRSREKPGPRWALCCIGRAIVCTRARPPIGRCPWSPITGATMCGCRPSAGERSACVPRIARSCSSQTAPWRIGSPPPCTWRDGS